MVTLRGFEIFVAVAEESSVTRAALRLHLSQPAVSHQVAALEREVGVALLDRGARGATPTREGRAFLEHARTALDVADRAVSSARSGSPGAAIGLVVAESFTLPFLVPVLMRRRARGRTTPDRASHVAIDVSETSSAVAAIESLRLGHHDLVLAPGPVDAAGLRVEVLGREEIVVVGPDVAGSPSPPISLAELAGDRLVGVDASNGFSDWLADRFAEAGVVARPAVRTRSLQNAAGLAAAGVGWSVVPRSAVAPGTPVSSLEPRLEREVLAVTRSAPSGVLADLLTDLRSGINSGAVN